MSLTINKVERKPLYAEAVQVTEENMADVALWCHGRVIPAGTDPAERNYIAVDVKNPMNERQTKAFVTDWVLFSHNGFKCFNNKAFRKSFVVSRVSDPTTEDVSKARPTVIEKPEVPSGGISPLPAEDSERGTISRDPSVPSFDNIPKQRPPMTPNTITGDGDAPPKVDL